MLPEDRAIVSLLGLAFLQVPVVSEMCNTVCKLMCHANLLVQKFAGMHKATPTYRKCILLSVNLCVH